MKNLSQILFTLLTTALLATASARADVISAAYSGVLDTPSGGENFMATFGDATTFQGQLIWDTINPNAIIDNNLTFFDSSGSALLELSGATTEDLYLENAYSGDADNIYMTLSYDVPVYGAVATSGLSVESWFDIYDASGDLLTADDQWPTEVPDLLSDNYQVNFAVYLWSYDIVNSADVGSFEGHVTPRLAVPAPASLLLVLPGLLLLRLRKK